MPYKNKEDRTDAVRRHREKKKGIADVMSWEAELRDFLKEIGFITMSWGELVEIAQEFTKDEEGVWRRQNGKRIYPPSEVYFLLDTMILW